METLTTAVDSRLQVRLRDISIESDVNADSCNDSIVKRAFDIAFAIGSLICSAPILLLAMIAIPLESRGWPLYIQQRVGQTGKVFKIFKLRTMTSGTDTLGFKTAVGDTRLTALGRMLRRTNLDELPQLVNVLLGDMSVIGPRPLSLDETDYLIRNLNIEPTHSGLIPRVRPGLVGLEQVNRNRELTYFERFEFNYLYEQSWSPFEDIAIFWKALSVCKEVCIAAAVGAICLFLAVRFGLPI